MGAIGRNHPRVRLTFRCLVLSPRWGSPNGNSFDLRLTPWAMILRRYAASAVGILLR